MTAQLVETWRFHNDLNLHLLRHLPEGGLGAVTLLKNGGPSKGRNVAKVLAHMHAVRLSGLPRDLKGGVPSFEKGAEPDAEALKTALAASGAAVETLLTRMHETGEGPRGHTPVSLLGYLISHESHHRGQIMLALKQSGLRAPDELRWGLWGYWRKLELPAE